jgi:predicted transglutaminase-like cysteine proteinase
MRTAIQLFVLRKNGVNQSELCVAFARWHIKHHFHYLLILIGNLSIFFIQDNMKPWQTSCGKVQIQLNNGCNKNY